VDWYHVWFDLRPGVKDLDLAASVKGMLDHMVRTGAIAGWGLTRRKLGFGPKEIGEWHVAIQVRDLAQLEQAFDDVTPRTGEMERLHAAVWSKVTNFRSGLYRDFPDPNRIYPQERRGPEHEVS
jgi:hypothetical protein